MPHRCEWCGDDPLYQKYHDEEWGIPVYDDKQMFTHLFLESFQAGLSWITILKKRENFAKAFAGFDPEKIAKFTEDDIQKLLQNKGIIRHRGKIEAVINNAKVFMDIQENTAGFSDMLWQFVNNKPVQNSYKSLKDMPSKTTTSEDISKHLKKLGFKFVGATTCYAHMQATGMVNDHVTDCYRHNQLKK